MKKLAKFRRALWILYDQVPRSQATYQNKLGQSQSAAGGEESGAKVFSGADKRTITQLIKRLKDEGFLERTRGGGTRLSTPVTTTEQVAKRHHCYSNPMTAIGHHVSDSFIEPPCSVFRWHRLTTQV